MVDWSKTILAIVKLAVKTEKKEVDPQFMVIKPAVLSDDNLLGALSALRMVLSFVPGANLAAHVLGLGDVGLRLWKRIALQAEYDDLAIPPVPASILSLKIRLDPVLREHFLHLLGNQGAAQAREVFEDFLFMTDPMLLHTKYPQVPEDYVLAATTRNKQNLGMSIQDIKQEIEKHRSIPEVDQNIKGAIDALTGLFPAMRDWSLMKSENFDEVVEIIDTIV